MTFDLWEVLEIVILVVGLAGTVYTLKGEVKSVRNDVERLEGKQDKYNHLQERMVRTEESCKSSHHRLDDISSVIRDGIDDMKTILLDHVEKFHSKRE